MIIILFWIISFSALGQQGGHSLLFRLGRGTYSMKTQKQFQQDFMRSSKVPLSKVHSFPAFPTFGASLDIMVRPNSSIGIWGEYASTGGRLHYQDYSGFSVMDQVLRSYQFGPYFQFHINQSIKWPIYLTLHGSVMHTVENLESETKLKFQSKSLSDETYQLKSFNYTLRPGLMIAHPVNVFMFQLGIGSEMQLHGDLKDKNNNELIFRTSKGKDLNAQWDGMRLTFGIGFQL